MNKLLRDVTLTGLGHLQAFSKIKIVAVDLDGTMSGSHDMEIWNNIIWIVNRLSWGSKKTNIIIATGRTLTGAKKAIELIYQTRDLPIILYNGSIIIKNNTFEILYKKTIPNTALSLIIDFAELYDISVFAYYYVGEEHSLFENSTTKEYVLGFGRDKTLLKEFNQMPIQWKFEESYSQNEPSAILIATAKIDLETKDAIIAALMQLPEISITSSGFAYIEIKPTQSDKAQALKFIAQSMGLTNADFAAIGDNDNDAEMLNWVGTGVAVSNGTEKAINSAKYVCSHNVASGVIEVLRLIKQSKRYHNG